MLLVLVLVLLLLVLVLLPKLYTNKDATASAAPGVLAPNVAVALAPIVTTAGSLQLQNNPAATNKANSVGRGKCTVDVDGLMAATPAAALVAASVHSSAAQACSAGGCSWLKSWCRDAACNTNARVLLATTLLPHRCNPVV